MGFRRRFSRSRSRRGLDGAGPFFVELAGSVSSGSELPVNAMLTGIHSARILAVVGLDEQLRNLNVVAMLYKPPGGQPLSVEFKEHEARCPEPGAPLLKRWTIAPRLQEGYPISRGGQFRVVFRNDRSEQVTFKAFLAFDEYSADAN